MPSLSFKPQFAPFILDHTKTHTLRGGSRFIAGDVCHCFTGLRTKHTVLLGRWRCVKTENVRIQTVRAGIGYKLELWFDGALLSDDEARAFAWRDGFRALGPARSMELFARFWAIENGLDELGKGWSGQLIHWDVKQPVVKVSKKEPRAAGK